MKVNVSNDKADKDLNGSGKEYHLQFWTPASGVDRKKAVIVAYGSMAMTGEFGAMIDRFCEGLCKKGYFVALPSYFECSGTTPGMLAAASTNATFDKWVTCMSAATSWARTQTGTQAAALVGFSLGGNLVLKPALTFPVNAVVDFFGPIMLFEDAGSHALTSSRVAGLPKTQIHHEKADSVVPLRISSLVLQGWLNTAGVKNEVHVDYACGH
jgi:dienelactone hydrolase